MWSERVWPIANLMRPRARAFASVFGIAKYESTKSSTSFVCLGSFDQTERSPPIVETTSLRVEVVSPSMLGTNAERLPTTVDEAQIRVSAIGADGQLDTGFAGDVEVYIQFLLPGVLVGTAIVSQVSPGWLKLATYIILLPLILLQAAGFRRPIKSERSVGLAFGGGVGVLYSVTTISGPPLAVLLSNQGLTKKDFRAALGLVRLAESGMTAVAYLYAGLYSATSLALVPWILPAILVGVRG